MLKKPEIKACEFCNTQFVDNTEYNQIACKSPKCQTKYVEWVHGDKEVVKTCTNCGGEYHPHWLTYFDKGVCWQCESKPEIEQSEQLTLKLT